LNEIRVRLATGRQQLENLNRQRGPMAARLTELTEILDARRADVAAYESRIQSLVAESDDLRRSAEIWREEAAALQANVTECLSARSEAHEKSGLVEAAVKAERQELIQLQDKKGALEVRAAQLELRTENLRSHTSRRYHADLEDFEPDSYALICSFRDRNKKKVSALDAQAEGSGEEDSPEPQPGKESPPLSQAPEENSGIIDWGRIEELVTELAERIEAMGPINLDAIQEYDELEQRQAFLEKQNADLVNSKAELHAVIAKINRTTRELFSETFERIRENFQIMFSELFGGGRANLLLVEESDPLESGIEIIAKPPGKQLQSVSLLSGGERTMTAVSLLFAIYMVKPSPFCVLDEMDAPLDESNINRFVKILDRFVEQSQFIVITHNKRTISRADVLYGVTMEEQGISKLVSVKFVPKQGAEAASQTEPFEKAGDLQSDPEPVTA
jgi:chromosome segregation protein